jgi:hypothetical protein
MGMADSKMDLMCQEIQDFLKICGTCLTNPGRWVKGEQRNICNFCHNERQKKYHKKFTVIERFWSFVNKTEGCWVWTGFIRPDGYGTFRHPETRYAHVAAYLMLVGPVEEGLEIDHLCRVRHCVRPEHLEAVTPRVNASRRGGKFERS